MLPGDGESPLGHRRVALMDEQAADARARELNLALGEAGRSDVFYVAEEIEPGVWDAVAHKGGGGRLRRLLDTLESYFPSMPWP